MTWRFFRIFTLIGSNRWKTEREKKRVEIYHRSGLGEMQTSKKKPILHQRLLRPLRGNRRFFFYLEALSLSLSLLMQVVFLPSSE